MHPKGGKQRRQRKQDNLPALPDDIHAVVLPKEVDHDFLLSDEIRQCSTSPSAAGQ
jgi:hypothetical protein